MIFIDILRTFYSLLLQIAPWVGVSLVITALSTEFLPASTFSRLIKNNKGNAIPIAVLFSVFLPATAVYKVLIAAFARRSGNKWGPVLAFVGAGACCGFAALIVTMVMGWQLVAVRLVVALVFGFLLAMIFAKYFEPSLASIAMDFEVESLFTRDFVEAGEENLDREDNPTLKDIWNGLVRITRISVPWFVLSVFLATLVKTIVPESFISTLLAGNLSVIWIALLGIPFYFIGGAEIPILYVLIQKGMDVGGASVFMLAAPLINAPVFVTMSRWIGYRKTAIFMAVCWSMIILIGFVIKYSVR